MKRLFRYILNTIPRPWLISISIYLRPLLDLMWRGKRFTDPINGKSYRRFLPYGYGRMRANVLSPGTLSLERHRLCWLYLTAHTGLFSEPLKVLHFAPEQAFYARFRALENLYYTTTDLNSPLADVKADITALPFDNDHYDLIICNHVLEHIPDDLKAMREIYRVLKPGGLAILQVPYEADRETTFQDDTITHQVFTKTMLADTTFTFANANIGMVKDFVLQGNYTPTFPAGTKTVSGTYSTTAANLIQIVAISSGDYWMSISQAQ